MSEDWLVECMNLRSVRHDVGGPSGPGDVQSVLRHPGGRPLPEWGGCWRAGCTTCAFDLWPDSTPLHRVFGAEGDRGHIGPVDAAERLVSLPAGWQPGASARDVGGTAVDLDHCPVTSRCGLSLSLLCSRLQGAAVREKRVVERGDPEGPAGVPVLGLPSAPGADDDVDQSDAARATRQSSLARPFACLPITGMSVDVRFATSSVRPTSAGGGSRLSAAPAVHRRSRSVVITHSIRSAAAGGRRPPARPAIPGGLAPTGGALS